MPAGTTATRSAQVPAGIPTVVSLDDFRRRTLKHEYTPITVPAAGPGQSWNRQLPQHGVLTKLTVSFEGTITVANNTGTVETTDVYPYDFLQALQIKLSGQDRWSCSGVDLKVLEYIRYAAYEPFSDAHPGEIDEVGGQALVDVVEAPFVLTFEVPLAADDVTFGGAVFAQATSFNAQLSVVQAAIADLFTLTADADVTIAGNWHVMVTAWDVPHNAEGALIIPDLSRVHAFNAFEDSFSGTGLLRHELINADARLLRLFASVRPGPADRLRADPDAAATEAIRAFTMSHGPQERPLDFDPAYLLRARNNKHYGGLVPYDRLVVDTVKEDALRDAIYMQGLTELAILVDIDSSVVVTQGRTRLVQETLI